MVTISFKNLPKTYQPTYLCDSSDSFDSCDISDSSEKSDNFFHQQIFFIQKTFLEEIFFSSKKSKCDKSITL